MRKRLKYSLNKKLFRQAVFAVFTIVLPLVLYNLYFADKIYPGIFLAGTYVGGKSIEEAGNLLAKTIKPPSKIVLVENQQQFDLDLSPLGFSYDFSVSGRSAYEFDRTGNFPLDLSQRLSAPFRKINLGLRIKIDDQKLADAISVIGGEIGETGLPPSIKIISGEIKVDKGKAGREVDLVKLRADIGHALSFNTADPILIDTKSVNPPLTDKDVNLLKSRGEKLLAKTLTVKFEFNSFTYKGNELLSFLGKNGYDEERLQEASESIAKDVDRSPSNPTFVFSEGRVKEFAPAREGIKTDKNKLKGMVRDAISQLENGADKEISIEAPVSKMPSEIQTSDVNNLGIKELIGRGTSRFRGSIPSRVFNINLAASRLNGVLIKPGGTFSFNDALGDVSKLTGYKEAYIIKDGKTVLGDGGGVCQVSTTLFRAALNAGLPITERVPHAYRVGYYEQDSPPGLDATVYSPTTDLKIENNTPGHILVQTTFNAQNSTLVFELYGTGDGRASQTSQPIVSGVTPPPSDLYQDDPTLPTGTVKQVDFKAWGAKVVFSYLVKRGDEIIFQRNFVSNYRPWQAVFLRGTAPIP